MFLSWYLDILLRSRSNGFYEKGVLKNLVNFTGKYLCRGLFFNKFAGWRTATLSDRDSCPSVFLWIIWEKINISLFTIPKREDLRKKWLNVLNHVRTKGRQDSFDVKKPNKRIYVCDFYFKDEELKTILGKGKKKVTLGRVPSIFREQPVK